MGSEVGSEELEWYVKHLKPLEVVFGIRELEPRSLTEGLKILGEDWEGMDETASLLNVKFSRLD